MNKIKQAHKTILEWDLKGCVYLNHLSNHLLVATFFKKVSRLGDGAFWLFMLMLVAALKGMHSLFELMYLLCFCGIGTLIYKFLKSKTVRPRPYQVHQVIILGERALDHFSFPSGHTLHAVMFTTVIGWLQPILVILMLPFSCLIALSRMILGLHYPTDVIVGAIIGFSIACGIIIFIA